MIFLALSILSSTLILVAFKLIGRYKVHTFSAIIVTYLTACLAGFFLRSSNPFTISFFSEKWFPIAILIGIMFIIMFYVIGKSTQNAGVAVTTVAVKMSVIAPIAFSIYYDANDSLTPIKLAGIILAVISVFLTVYKKNDKKLDLKKILLPAFLFIGMGIVDSFVKFAQSTYISSELTPTFSSLTFSVSLLVGILILPFNRSAAKSLISVKSWILGALLGLFNFGSMYFLILALNHVDISTGQQAMGSVIFGINNIGIVGFSVLIGFSFFNERPTRINWAGIILSLFAIFILSLS